MTPPEPPVATLPAAAAEFPGGRTAIALGAALLAGVLAVIALALVERGSQAKLESAVERTAAGDFAFYLIPRAPASPVPVTWNGKPLRVNGSEKIKQRDTTMLRLGETDGGAYRIYTPATPEAREGLQPLVPPGDLATGAHALFLKAEPDEYWSVQVEE